MNHRGGGFRLAEYMLRNASRTAASTRLACLRTRVHAQRLTGDGPMPANQSGRGQSVRGGGLVVRELRRDPKSGSTGRSTLVEPGRPAESISRAAIKPFRDCVCASDILARAEGLLTISICAFSGAVAGAISCDGPPRCPCRTGIWQHPSSVSRSGKECTSLSAPCLGTERTSATAPCAPACERARTDRQLIEAQARRQRGGGHDAPS